MKKVFLIGFILFQISKGFAQYTELGGEFGYVVSSVANSGYRISFNAHYFPIHAIFYVNTGLTYENEDHWNFLQLPLGITFSPGKKVKFLAGTGILLSYATISKEYYSAQDILSINDFQLNLFFLLGCRVQLNKFINLSIKPEYELGLSTLYKSPRKNDSYLVFKKDAFSINIGLSFKILKNEANKPSTATKLRNVAL